MPLTRWFPLFYFCCTIFLAPNAGRAEELAECQELWRHGKYAECIERTRPLSSGGHPQADRFGELKARAEAATGQYEAACETLKEAIRQNPFNIWNRWLLIELAPYSGNDWAAVTQRRQLESIITGRTGQFMQDSANLVILARFALDRHADPKQVQDVLLKKARDADPLNIDPHLLAGELALEKRDFALAAEAYRKALTLDRQHPDALFGLARALAGSDPQTSAELLQQVLSINPRHADALLHQAETLIHAEQYPTALNTLNEVIAVNPLHPEALALQSAIHFLQGNAAEAESLRNKALSTWNANPRVDFLIGRTLSQKYRFEAGAQSQRRALEFQGNYLPSIKQLAQDLLRLGQEREGWQLADAAFHRDQYDVASYNLITLRDELEKFATLERNGLLVRMEQQEAAIYGERVLDLLTEAREVLCQKYEVELSKTILVEIFPKPADFAVRTFGLPGAGGYLGVCFGDVITARSPGMPDAQPVNWESVLWHEFTHVITLNKTHNRMPRWLSEGISVYEERQRNPIWGEHMTPVYRDMILKGELTPVSKLSGAFLAPQSPRHLMFAYYESSLVTEYLIENYGQAALLAILDDLALGMDINTAISRHSVPMPQLEDEFAAYARRLSLLYGWSVDWTPPDFASILKTEDPADQLLDWARKHPRNYPGLKTCGALLVKLKQPEQAARLFQLAIDLFPYETGTDSALAQLAELQYQLGDHAGEQDSLAQLARMDDEAASSLLRLIEIEIAKQNWENVQRYANDLIAIKPLIPQPYVGLAQSAEQRQDHRLAIQALNTLLKFTPVDRADVHYRLAIQHQQTQEISTAKRHVLQSLEDAPRYRAALKLLLELQQQPSTSRSPPVTPEPEDIRNEVSETDSK